MVQSRGTWMVTTGIKFPQGELHYPWIIGPLDLLLNHYSSEVRFSLSEAPFERLEKGLYKIYLSL